MPNVSTYIRSDDLAKYLLIAKEKGAWSEFIHNALDVLDSDGQPPTRVEKELLDALLKEKPKKSKVSAAGGTLVKAPMETLLNIPGVQRASELEAKVKLCKVHSMPLDGRGRCMQKGCKFS